jgi:WD40 repeat protein
LQNEGQQIVGKMSLEETARSLIGELSVVVDDLIKENRSLRQQLAERGGAPVPPAAAASSSVSAAHRFRELFNANFSSGVGGGPGSIPRGGNRAGKPDKWWRLEDTYSLHKDAVWEVTGTPLDPALFCSASSDGTVKLWHSSIAGNDSCIFSYQGHKGSVNSARFHPKNVGIFVTASGDLDMHIVQLPTELLNQRISLNSVKKRPSDSKTLNQRYSAEDASFGLNAPQKKPGDQVSAEELGRRSHSLPDLLSTSDFPPRPAPDPDEGKSFSDDHNGGPDDDVVALEGSRSGNRSNSVPNIPVGAGILNSRKDLAADEATVLQVRAHAGPISAADWILDGEYLASGSWDSLCHVWSINNGELVKSQSLKGHEDRITNIDTLTDMKIVLTSSSDHSFRLWDLRSNDPQVSVFHGHSG